MGKKPGASNSEDDKTNNPNPGDSENENPENLEGSTDDKQGEGDGEGEGDDNTGFKTVEEANAYIAKLRKENAKRRTTAKNLEGQLAALTESQKKMKAALGIEDEESPEEKAETLAQQNVVLQLELGIANAAADLGVPKEHRNYFRFLVNEKLEALEEGEELTDADFDEIAQQVSALGGGKSKNRSSGVNDNGAPAAGNKPGTVTVEQFSKMTTAEKSELFAKDSALYNRLFAEARQKRLL